MEYQIVEAVGVYDLEKKVCSLIKDGWVPLGGVSINTTFNDSGNKQWTYAFQAMTRQTETGRSHGRR